MKAILERIEALLAGESRREEELVQEAIKAMSNEELVERLRERVAHWRGEGPPPRPLIDSIRPQRTGTGFYEDLSDEELLQRLAEKRESMRKKKAERENRGRHGG